jgi:hypothetical protein
MIADKLLTVAQNDQAIAEAVEDIRLAIVAKDVPVAEGTPISQFPSKIAAIEGGGGGSAEVHTVYIVDHTGIVAEIPVAHGGDVTLPEPQVYDDLVFSRYDGDPTNITGNRLIAAQYRTVNDWTYVDIEVTPATGLNITFLFGRNDSTYFKVLWGFTQIGESEEYYTDTIQMQSGSGTLSWGCYFPAYGRYRVKFICDAPNYLGWGYDNYRFVSGDKPVVLNVLLGSKTRLYSYSLKGQMFINSVMFPDNYTYTDLEDYVFGAYASTQSVSLLKALVLPVSIVTVGIEAWYRPDNLRCFYCCSMISAAASINFYTARRLICGTFERIPSVFGANDAFSGCYNLRWVRLPIGTTSLLASSTFNACRSLEFVEGLEQVEAFGSVVFSGCYSLKATIDKDFITLSGAGQFQSCYNLNFTKAPMTSIPPNSIFVGVNFPDVLELPAYATSALTGFAQVVGVQTLILNPATAGYSTSAFGNIQTLREVICLRETPPTISTTSFDTATTPRPYLFYVPDASLSAYKAATNWAAYADRIFPISQRPTT